MRRFLYYDEDSINSFLAQIEKGLLTKKGKEKEIHRYCIITVRYNS